MIQIPMKSAGPLTKQTVLSVNRQYIQGARTSENIGSINHRPGNGGCGSDRPGNVEYGSGRPGNVEYGSGRPGNVGYQNDRPGNGSYAGNNNGAESPACGERKAPPLQRPARKGQKVALEAVGPQSKISARLGWNVTNAACDVDVSAFLLGENGKVLGDTWFVFYGQEGSPDGSTRFSAGQGADREMIAIDFARLHAGVNKIVFVLTINEALEKRLNFSMIRDAYVRIMDERTDTELVSFQMDEYYANVTSMMIGELYRYHGSWKFNAIGNGVARDLAGLCELYGVQVI